MAPRVHDTFAEIKIHTAKCDSCNRRNKFTIFQCKSCGFQQCTPCWNEKGEDDQHEFILPVRKEAQIAPSLPTANSNLDLGLREAPVKAQRPKKVARNREDVSLSECHVSGDDVGLEDDAMRSDVKDLESLVQIAKRRVYTKNSR